MLLEPECYTRRCVHYRGITWTGREEKSEINFCNVFPEGIPSEIAYGNDLHLTPKRGQGNTIVFEKIKEEE
jgi:hypothetical protein|tara:strand:- start:99 stop:311 length:213 start_codon:yes stop_codon:yes gene_type:complete